MAESASKSCSSTESSKCGRGKDGWWLYRPKNVITQGTLGEENFHISLLHRDRLEDPLSIPLLSDWIPYYCVPHCGVYGQSDYHLTHPLGLIELPSDELINRGALFVALPKELQHYLTNDPVTSAAEVDVQLIIHSLPSFENSVDPSARQVNVMFHMWALKGVDVLSIPEVHITMEMGGFSPVGIAEVLPVCLEAEELNGLVINGMGRRILHVHDLSFSPHNAQVALMDSYQLHAFLSVGRLDSGRTAITYHIIPSSEEAERRVIEVIKSSVHVADLTRLFEAVERDLNFCVAEDTNTCTISCTLTALTQAACGCS